MVIVPELNATGLAADAIQAKVLKVFDGDGFLAKVWDPYRCRWIDRVACRLAFIDAPEMDQPYGPESRNFLARSIAGKSLGLSPVYKGSTSPSFIDPYRRFLCVGYLTDLMHAGTIDYFMNGQCASGRVRNAREVVRNIELEMVVNGFAWVNELYSFDEEAEYFEAQTDARRNRRGLWAMDEPEAPWIFKRRQRRSGKDISSQPPLF